MHGNYRPDIDGLRAVAVGGVLLFHAGITTFSGGYVGVDVFFVLSGFLITSILLRDTSLLGFYQRRARRILPALLVMMLVVLALSLVIMLPYDLIDLGGSIISTVMFVSNIFFWRQAGYFKPEVELMPLLHTWSLGVEEQFYIFFPLVIILVRRLWPERGSPQFFAVVFTIAALVSLALSQVFIIWGQAYASFYLLPTRAWELLVGSILATGAVPQLRTSAMRSIVALTGFVAVCIPMLAYDKFTPFPGVAALPPVLGTAMIIHAGTGGTNLVARVLSLRPVVFVGLLSYSLYLWHWPVLALLHYRLVRELTVSETVIALGLSFGLAWLSWRFVEQPFRKGFSDSAIWKMSGAGLATFGLCGVAILGAEGLASRFPQQIAELNEDTMDTWGCPVDQMQLTGATRVCDINLQGGDLNSAQIVLWGDSHAQSYGPAFISALGGKRGMIAYVYGCPPVSADDACIGKQEAFFQNLLSMPADVVLLAHNWAGSAGPLQERDSYNLAQRQAGYQRAMQATAETARLLVADGKRVILITPLPRPGFNVPSIMSRELAFFGKYVHAQGMSLAQYHLEYRPVLDAMDALDKASPGISVLHVEDKICEGGFCRFVDDEGAVFADPGHLAEDYTATLGPLFKLALNGATHHPGPSKAAN